MTEVNFKSDFDVLLVRSAGDDQGICQAARVSTLGASSIETEESRGLLNFLMKNRHGSPFEHALMTFRISAPIFVWREFMRHRIGYSYNEQSGRYMEMEPSFYVPRRSRPIVQTGKPGQYIFGQGTDTQINAVEDRFKEVCHHAWFAYQDLLQAGVAKEVARMCLPLSIYSTAFVTCNPRSLMSFLSLRTYKMYSAYPSFPQWEIAQVASKMEHLFMTCFPITHQVWDDNGRVSP